jgi:hypothetical protein
VNEGIPSGYANVRPIALINSVLPEIIKIDVLPVKTNKRRKRRGGRC